MENIRKVYLMSILLCIISSAAVSGSPEVTVVIDGYTVDSTQSSPASLPLGTSLVLVCRVSGIPQRQIKYNWICPNGPCEHPEYAGRKVVNGNILAVNITSDSDGGTYTCEVSRDDTDGGYRQNYTLNDSGGHVIHSYGRLVHHTRVITRGDQLLPPGDVTGPGRMDCKITVPGTARFKFAGTKPPSNSVSQSDEDGDQMDTLFFNRSYLPINIEGYCLGASDSYFCLYLSPGTLSNVTIKSAVPSTTDVRIVLNDIQSDIHRVIIGYERHDLGVTLQGEYRNIGRRRWTTFSPLVPGARYTVVVQGLSEKTGHSSQHVTRRDFKTKEKEPSAPRYPCISGKSSNGIELNWIPPLEPNGDVYYLIDDGNSTVNTSSESTYFTLTGLQRGVTYNITVVAVNSAGRSDTGAVLNYTHNPQTSTPPPTPNNSSANVTAGAIGAIAVLLIVVSTTAIVIVIVCIIKHKRKKGVPEGNGEANNTDHYYSTATENAVPQPPGIQGDNKNDMIVYDQVEGEGLNGTDTYEDPDAGVKVHNKVINAKTSGNGKQNTNIPAKYSKLQQNVPQEPHQWESIPSEGYYDVADSRPYKDKYDMIGSGMYVNSAAAKEESENVPITQPNTKLSKGKHLEDINDEMPKNGNHPSEFYTQPNKARKHNEELHVTHDQVDLDELYTQPAKKKKIKKPPPYASRRKNDDPEALYTAVDKVKKRKN